MDVNNTEARREVELARRMLKDREVEHSRELDNLRKSNREQIDELTTNQRDSLKHVHEDAERSLDESRERFDDAIAKNTDHYEKRLNEERTEAYDRYGRLATESAREKARMKEQNSRNLNQLIADHERSKASVEQEHEKTLEKVEHAAARDKQKILKSYDKKLAAKDEAMKEALHKQQAGFRDSVAEAENRSSKMNNRDRAAAEARYNKLLEDSRNEQERLARTAKTREEQMRHDSGLLLQRQKQHAQRAFDEYRDRAADALNSTIDHNNKKASQTARAHEAQLSKMYQDHQAEKARMNNEFRSLTSDLEAKNEMEAARNALRESLNEKRHRQELNLTQNAITENNQLNTDEMRTRYHERLRDVEEKNRRDFERHQAAAQNKAFSAEMSHTSERAQLDRQHTTEMTHLAAERARERNNLVRQYEQRQRATEDVADHQRAETQRKARGEMKALRDQTSKTVAEANRDKQARVYEMQQTLRNRTDELEMLRKIELDDASNRFSNRIKRMSEMYNRNLIANKDAFDEESSSFKHESQMQMLKARGDAEHEKRMALLDVLSKNRAQISSMEAKFNEMKDQHEAELAKLKAENDKALRESQRRSRELMETERTRFERELEAKDLASKEKLKLQEEAFRDQIEKLKRSHELALKKS